MDEQKEIRLSDLSQDEREELRRQQLEAKAASGSTTAIQIIEKLERKERLDSKRKELMAGATFGKPEGIGDQVRDAVMPNITSDIQKLNDLDLSEIEQYIRRGELKSLPEHMSVYLSWMETAHDWYYKFKSKNWVVKYLMANCKDADENPISVYLANKIFEDQLNFFYSDKNFKKNSMYLYLYERVMMGAELAWEDNDVETYTKAVERAATILDKVKLDQSKTDPRLLERRPRFYVTDAKQLGVPPIDRNALARSIDEMPIPESVKNRVKGDLGVLQRNLLDEDVKDELKETE